MGVPYYFYVITKTYEGILIKSLPSSTKCDHFMMDFNGLIHPSSQVYLKNLVKIPKDIEKGIMNAIWKDTIDIIKMVDPQKTVQIYIDGVAPIAKMNQQRKRRFMSVFRKKLLESNDVWDSNCISPGTPFMTRLHASIRSHIRYSKDTFRYYFSTSDEAGEGEHKLFREMLTNYNSPEDVKVIYGMDADLIMLSLFSHLPNIYLLREDQHSNDETDKYVYLNIDVLRIGIIKDLKTTFRWNIPEEAMQNSFHQSAQLIIETYCVICFILGNDFIPHPVCIDLKKGGLQFILTEAGKIWNYTLPQKSLDWNFIRQLFEKLGQYENENILGIVSNHYNKKAHFTNKEEEVEAYPIVNKETFINELITNNKWRLYYYKHLFNNNINDSRIITNSCKLYLEGIMWTYLYYTRQPKDNTWYYPYAYSPTLCDITNYLNSESAYFENLKNTWNMRDVFCEPIVQLLSILPKESVECLPIKYRCLMLNNEELEYLYPSSYIIQTFMKTKLWECSQLLPPLNVSLVKKIVDTIK